MESGINEEDKGGTMERTRCKKCKCWNKKHFIYKQITEEKDPDVGICERHAPRQHFLNPVMQGGPMKMFPGTHMDEGCWEGIPKK